MIKNNPKYCKTLNNNLLIMYLKFALLLFVKNFLNTDLDNMELNLAI